MDWSHIMSFALVAALLTMSPGPNGVLIAKTVPSSGRQAGFLNIAGFIAAFHLHGALSIFGISLILVKSAEAFFIVKTLGAAYLFWIGVKALHDAWRGGVVSPREANPRRISRRVGAFAEGFLTNALNPKVSMFYLAAFPQFIPTGGGAISSAFLLVVIHSVIVTVWFSVMILLFSRLTAAARSGAFQRWLKAVTGVVFIGFGAKLMALRP